MERQGRRRLFEALADFSRRHTLGPALDQQAKNIQARVLRQSPQRRDYSGLVHSSIPLGECQYIGQPDQKASPGRALGLSSLLSPSFCRSVSPEAKIILRLERTNTLAQKPFLFPLLILGEGEGEVTRPDPDTCFALSQWHFAKNPPSIIFALGSGAAFRAPRYTFAASDCGRAQHGWGATSSRSSPSGRAAAP